MASNQLRLWLATLAYLLLERLRSLTLGGTELARATAGTIRLKLLKVAAAVSVSVRRVPSTGNISDLSGALDESTAEQQLSFRQFHR